MRSVQSTLVAGLCLAALLTACTWPNLPPPAAPVPTPQPRIIAPPPQPRSAAEIRAVWVSETAKLDWDRATRDLQAAGFNTMYVNFASAGAAFYPDSKVVPSIVDAASDPVARGIYLAHQRGIAVYAKVIVMFSFDSPPDYQHQLLKSDRVMRGADGKPILQSGVYWVCPCQPANRHVAVSLVTEILSKYPVDGLQFDYIRFNENPSCFCRHCRAEFEKSIDESVRHWPADVMTGDLAESFNNWREAVITDWMRDLSARARETRPGIRLAAAVFPDLERARAEKAQDWKRWIDRGYLDFICPMNYATDPAEFARNCQLIFSAVPRDRVVMGIGSWKLGNEDLARRLNFTRKLGAAGFAMFSYDDAAERQLFPVFFGGR